MLKRSNLLFGLALAVMLVFFVVKTSVLIEIVPSTSITRGIEYLCFLSFIPLFWIIMKEFIGKGKESIRENKYVSTLNASLIWQARNECFYAGDISGSSKLISREISVVMEADRVSIWLYSENKDSIICDQLYVKSDNRFYSDIELKKIDFPEYFESLENDPIIIANDAETNPSTSCFTETYLKPLGIKSMLDVPIWHKGQVLGVICVENLKLRKWKESEIAYCQMLSSLYSFGFSVKENLIQERKSEELQHFINTAALVSMADEKGKITYVNKKFTEVSGWSLEEALGKDHNIVNSGVQPKGYWTSMYKKVLAGEIWNDVVVNKAKDGHIYYVDTFIKAQFDEKGKLEGFTSIRQDVTEIVKSVAEIEKKNTYLEHAAKIIRHDMHSGINTYIPRGISSLERRLTEEQIKDLKIEAPLKMIKEGLRHTQKVYKGVYEFTNLVKKDSVLNRNVLNLTEILEDYLSATAYRPQVVFENLGFAFVNEALFCTALDNLIRNGLKYNDSLNKVVKIRRESDFLYIEDNGRGMSSEDFKMLSQPYKRKEGQKESGTGLGLNICIAILEEHGFSVSCDKLPQGGTQMKINIKQ